MPISLYVFRLHLVTKYKLSFVEQEMISFPRQRVKNPKKMSAFVYVTRYVTVLILCLLRKLNQSAL